MVLCGVMWLKQESLRSFAADSCFTRFPTSVVVSVMYLLCLVKFTESSRNVEK